MHNKIATRVTLEGQVRPKHMGSFRDLQIRLYASRQMYGTLDPRPANKRQLVIVVTDADKGASLQEIEGQLALVGLVSVKQQDCSGLLRDDGRIDSRSVELLCTRTRGMQVELATALRGYLRSSIEESDEDLPETEATRIRRCLKAIIKDDPTESGVGSPRGRLLRAFLESEETEINVCMDE